MNKSRNLQYMVISCFLLISLLLAGCKQVENSSTSATLTNIDVTTTTRTTSVSTDTVLAGMPVEAPISIDKSFNGRTVHANLVKYSGIMPSPDAAILVNGNAITVEQNGNYYVYLDLQEGQNSIEIKTTTGADTKTEYIQITFTPPLSIQVALDLSKFHPITDFNIPSEIIVGIVSDPAAEVTVNDTQVTFKPNGTFTAKIAMQLGTNNVHAVAKLGSDEDKEFLSWVIADNGQLMVIPGTTSLPNTLPAVTIKAGESAGFNFSLQFNKAIPDSSLNTIVITRIAKPGVVNNTLPELTGLKVKVMPSTYHIYSRIKYTSTVAIETAENLPPGDYYFHIGPSLGAGAVFNTGNDVSRVTLNVASNPPNGADFVMSVK